MKFPRQPKREGGWTIRPGYLLQVSKKIKQMNDEEDIFDEEPSMEQIEMVLLAIEDHGEG